MTTTGKRSWINWLLLVFSIVITLVVAEVVFQRILFGENEAFKSLRDPSLYGEHIKHKNGDFFDDNYWKLNYIFNKPFDIKEPDSLLCWTGSYNRDSYEHFARESVKGRRPVLLFGDSFAQCVDTVKCFEDIMNEDSIFAKDHYLLNYGTGGFGVDQIYLLFHQTANRYEKPFVIFALLTTDMDRCMLSFRDAQKPYFKLRNEELELHGTPIKLSSEEYINQNPPEITSYLWNRFKNSDFYFVGNNDKKAEERIEEIQALNKQILLKSFSELKALGTDYIVMLFHPAYHHADDWRLVFARELLEQENIPYLADIDVINADTTFEAYNLDNYCIPGNGHPTSHLNKLISKEIEKVVLNSSYSRNLSQDTTKEENIQTTDGY